MNFNNFNDNEKLFWHNKLSECAESFGGANYFLQLIEAMRSTKPHPLIHKDCVFHFALGSVKWHKVIFKDKLMLLLSARQQEGKNNNLLPAEGDKHHKNVMNLVRTLKPIEFKIKPKNIKHGDGFSVYPFDILSDKVTKLNPIFDALFFSSVDNVRNVLSYKPQQIIVQENF